jgi:GNAT superfamily N-acetyltransferase
MLAVDDRRTVGGFASVQSDVLEHLYVSPQLQSHGLGTRLLDAAKEESPHGLACVSSDETYPRVGSTSNADSNWLNCATVRQMKKASLTPSMSG